MMPDYCEGCNQRFAPIDQQSCWSCKDGEFNSSKRGQRMTKTMEKRLDQMDSGVIALCETISQVKKALCGNEKATHEELLQAVSQVKNRLAQVERERDAAVADLKSVDEKYESLKSMIDDVTFNHEPYGLYLDFREAADAMVEHEHADVWRGVRPENTKEEA